MSILRMIYLALAILGTILPWIPFLPWIEGNGLDLVKMIAAAKSNGVTTGLYYDLLISALALNVWIVAETYVRKDYWVLLCVPAIYLIGVSCALPLFLFLRTRPVV
jgi:hypothetical protein